ncbi:MAG: hypothetical protein CSA81_09845 [Acidobacteria bacterium]|nr:MAG: hypothetical protein CSA81_09845 [Acidobacteriota bacterium]
MEITSFIFNRELIRINESGATPLVDWIRHEKGHSATKIGCREGDCGACTVVLAEKVDETWLFQAVTSCIMPLERVHGKWVITLEGVTPDRGLNPVQAAFARAQATQCGFCTPGFLMALTAHILNSKTLSEEELLTAIDGNLCRCTGYQSIRRAIRRLVKKWNNQPDGMAELKRQLLPVDLNEIAAMMQSIKKKNYSEEGERPFVAGATDYMVQLGYPHRRGLNKVSFFVREEEGFKSIRKEQGCYYIGAGVTASQLFNNREFAADFPGFSGVKNRVSSTPIRNVATLGGNLVNASPIADFAIALLVLDCRLQLMGAEGERQVQLKDFFKDYKLIDLKPGERVRSLVVPVPAEVVPGGVFHFEKISKRDILDIASVNSAAFICLEGNRIVHAALSAGGVAPVPLLLEKTGLFLCGRELSIETLKGAQKVASSEISPISDIRGTAAYKSKLLEHLVLAHFVDALPEAFKQEAIWLN